ncbi:MAG: hypothetical protein ACK4I8_00425 [Armatimonadota bacterium]
MSPLFVAYLSRLKSLLQKIWARPKNFGSLESSPSGGRGYCRAVISAGRQVGRSANWQVGMSVEKFRLTRMFALQNGKIFRLTRGLPSRTEFFSAHQRFALQIGLNPEAV